MNYSHCNDFQAKKNRMLVRFMKCDTEVGNGCEWRNTPNPNTYFFLFLIDIHLIHVGNR